MKKGLLFKYRNYKLVFWEDLAGILPYMNVNVIGVFYYCKYLYQFFYRNYPYNIKRVK